MEIPGRSEVVVLGGGVMGCAVARALALRGCEVVILERAIPGAEASSAAAGILGAQSEPDEPGPFFDLLMRSRKLYAGFAKDLEKQTGIGVNYRECGVLMIATGEAHQQLLDERARWQERLGLVLHRLSGKEALALEPRLTARVLGALHIPGDAQIEPPLLARALARGAELAGARFIRTSVRRIVHDEKRVRAVETDAGRIEAERVVLAAGAWSCQVPGSGLAEGAVQPVRGQVAQLEGTPGTIGRVIMRPREGGKVYLVPRADGRVLLGATTERAGFEKRVTAGGLAQLMGMAVELIPSLESAPFVDAWANFRPWTSDGLPVLGEGPIRGIHFASGHYRNGILLTPVTAELLAQEICGEALALDLGPFRPARFAGRPL